VKFQQQTRTFLLGPYSERGNHHNQISEIKLSGNENSTNQKEDAGVRTYWPMQGTEAIQIVKNLIRRSSVKLIAVIRKDHLPNITAHAYSATHE
jgi:hypothetical protein